MEPIAIDEECSERLIRLWNRCDDPILVRLNTPAGAGGRRLIRKLQWEVSDQCLTWHARFIPDEWGVDALPKLMGGLWKGIRHSDEISARIERVMHYALNELDAAEDKQRMQVLIDSLRIYRESEGEKVVLPSNRPLLAIVQLALILAQVDPVLIILEDIHNTHSPLPYALLSALLKLLPDGCKVMIVITADQQTTTSPVALEALLGQYGHTTVDIKPWGFEQLKSYLAQQQSMGAQLDIDTMGLEWWSKGYAGRVLELTEYLQGSEDAPNTMPPLSYGFQSSQAERLFRTASLIDTTISIKVLGILCELSKAEVLALIETHPHIARATFHDPMTGLQHMEFTTATLQLHLLESTVQGEPRGLLEVAERLNQHVGTVSPSLMLRSLFLKSLSGTDEEIHEQQQLLLSQERDDIWLQLLDLQLRFELESSAFLIGQTYVGSVRFLFSTDQDNSEAALATALEWAKENNAAYTAAELLLLATDYFFKKGRRELIPAVQQQLTTIMGELRSQKLYFRNDLLLLQQELSQALLPDEKKLRELLERYNDPLHQIAFLQTWAERTTADGLYSEARSIAKSAQFTKLSVELGIKRLSLLEPELRAELGQELLTEAENSMQIEQIRGFLSAQ